jgi:hypothetical protein
LQLIAAFHLPFLFLLYKWHGVVERQHNEWVVRQQLPINLWTRCHCRIAKQSKWVLVPPMALHMLKLCVGCESIKDLSDWIEDNQRIAARQGRAWQQRHTTRMLPKRLTEIAGQGSLYWVIKGQISCRQTISAIEPFIDGEGISRCDLVLENPLVPVEPRPFRPFQGWRYLEAKDAPRDLGQGHGSAALMPEELRRELAHLGLL